MKSRGGGVTKGGWCGLPPGHCPGGNDRTWDNPFGILETTCLMPVGFVVVVVVLARKGTKWLGPKQSRVCWRRGIQIWSFAFKVCRSGVMWWHHYIIPKLQESWAANCTSGCLWVEVGVCKQAFWIYFQMPHKKFIKISSPWFMLHNCRRGSSCLFQHQNILGWMWTKIIWWCFSSFCRYYGSWVIHVAEAFISFKIFE